MGGKKGSFGGNYVVNRQKLTNSEGCETIVIAREGTITKGMTLCDWWK